MKTKRQQQQKYLDLNNSLNSSETIDDCIYERRDYSINQHHISANDQQALNYIQEENYTQASLVLHQLTDLIESDFTMKDQMVKSYRLFVCYYNLAVIYWRLSKYYEAEKYLKQSINYMEFVLTLCQYKEEYLIFTIQLIKVELQECVVLSQNGHHSEASSMSKDIITRLFQCFHVQMAMAQQMQAQLQKNKKNKTKNRIDFKNVVINEAKQKLNFLCDLQKSYKLSDSSEQQLNQIIKNLYTWKKNLQNNEKFMKMSLNIDQKTSEGQRNILGIPKTPEWIEDFNIGVVMVLTPVKMNFKPNLDTFYILSTNKILQLIVYASVSFFTFATQIRFKQLELGQKKLSASQKFMKMNDNSQILKCKILHLKAIELVGRYMPSSNQYISHLISSFNKNYKFYMEKIDQQNSYLIDNQSLKKSFMMKTKEGQEEKKKRKSYKDTKKDLRNQQNQRNKKTKKSLSKSKKMKKRAGSCSKSKIKIKQFFQKSFFQQNIVFH